MDRVEEKEPEVTISSIRPISERYRGQAALSAELDAVMEMVDSCTSCVAVEPVLLRNCILMFLDVILAIVNSHTQLVTIH